MTAILSTTFHRGQRMRSQRGAQIVELAIAIPLFIGLIFGIFDMARIVSGKSAARSAANIGARYSAATHRPEWQVVQDIFQQGDQIVSAQPLTTSEFTYGGGNNLWYECMRTAGNQGNQHCTADGERDTLSSIYRIEAQAIAIANNTFANNIGSTNFPCDADKNGEPGCFRCFTLRGNTSDFRDVFSIARNGGRTWMGKVLGIRCEYDVPITSTLVGFGWLPNHVTVRGDAFTEVDFLDYASYRNDTF